MPRTLRQLWADEDHAHEHGLDHKQRPSRPRARHGARLRRSVAVRGRRR
ncbi:MAG TPA: hypothetical protein VJ735_07050 [Actinomycetes bacterium]|nr:hypothetical protein [Actinomycetes bacterium]